MNGSRDLEGLSTRSLSSILVDAVNCGVNWRSDLANPSKSLTPGECLPHAVLVSRLVALQDFTLMVHAKKDPIWANLDRIQLVKGWIADGKPME